MSAKKSDRSKKAKTTAPAKPGKSKASTAEATTSKRRWYMVPLSPFVRYRRWRKSLRPRTPHRSFRRTRRRDYVRSLEMPGYVAFTAEVWRMLWRYKRTFILLVALYALASGVLVGMASQAMYTQLAESIRTTGDEIFDGDFSGVNQAGLLLLIGLSGGLNVNLNEAQQLLSGFLILMAWLTTVWLLRAYFAGRKPRLLDAIYNAGAPIIPTMLLTMFLMIQLVPAAIAAIGVSAAMPTNLISEGVESMLFWLVVLLLVILSLYWVTSTLIALIVVTLPGMYPLRALKAAHELVVGRRLRIVLRVVWLALISLLFWALTMIPIILFDAWLKGPLPEIEWLPIVPLSLLVIGSFWIVWAASYMYLLYRKIVDDDAAPA